VIDKPCDCAEDEGPEGEPGVPLVLMADGDDAQEEEDDAVGEGAHGLDGILDGGVTLLGNVGEGVPFLGDSASNLENQFKVRPTSHTIFLHTILRKKS